MVRRKSDCPKCGDENPRVLTVPKRTRRSVRRPESFDPFAPQPGLGDREEFLTKAMSWKGSFDDILISEDYQKFTSTPIHTIYSRDNEAEQENLEVPLQEAFTGPSFILPENIADTCISDLGVHGILKWMNEILGTGHKLTPEMKILLQFGRDTFTNFGQAYALLRPRWHMHPTEALKNIEERREEDLGHRSRALKGDVVENPLCRPRRLWDLWSNRVVPIWVVTVDSDPSHWLKWRAISHSWVEKNSRREVSSPINGYEWLIPIPADTTLERIRIELLNIAAAMPAEEQRRNEMYPGHNSNLVWLDILCLRQEGVQPKEDVRKVEWRLDVPTIGPVYMNGGSTCAWTIYYFSGLGRPFVVSPKDKDDPRHWMNRAWTLQETQQKIIIAGRSPSSPHIPHISDLGDDSDRADWVRCMNRASDAVLKTLMTPFSNLHDNHIRSTSEVFEALNLMRHRSATSELDKIAGLVFRFNKFKPPLPAYIVDENPEDAWDRLIETTDEGYRAHLFFCYPEPGNGKYVWYPSWQQIKDIKVLPIPKHLSIGTIDFEKFNDAHSAKYSIHCSYFDNCVVKGLSKVRIDSTSTRSPATRKGTAIVMDKEGVEHTIKVEANHNVAIPEGIYTLVVADVNRYSFGFCAVARRAEEGLVEKVSVIRIVGSDSQSKIFHVSSLQLL